MPVRGLAQGTKSACPSWCRTSADRESSANKPESSTNCDAAETLSSWFHSNILDKTCNCRCHDQRGMLCYCMLWALQSHYNHRFWFWRSGERLVVVWPEAASTVGWERRSPRRNLLVHELITALTIGCLWSVIDTNHGCLMLSVSQQKHKPDTCASCCKHI